MQRKSLDLSDPHFFYPENAELDVQGQYLGAENCQDVVSIIIPFLKSHPEIKILNLDNSYPKLGSDGFISLISKIAETNVTTLHVVDQLIGYMKFDESLGELETNTNLQMLDISYNFIGEQLLKALAKTNLTTLVAQHCNISDEAVAALAQNTSLVTLDLTGNGLSDKGVKIIAQNTSLPNLENLTLNFNTPGTGDDGARALAEKFSLRTLSLHRISSTHNVRIGREASKALAANINLEVLGGCEFEVYEGDPRKRANYGRDVGLKTDVPSLLRLSLFKVQQSDFMDLPKEQQEKLLPVELLDRLDNRI